MLHEWVFIPTVILKTCHVTSFSHSFIHCKHFWLKKKIFFVCHLRCYTNQFCSPVREWMKECRSTWSSKHDWMNEIYFIFISRYKFYSNKKFNFFCLFCCTKFSFTDGFACQPVFLVFVLLKPFGTCLLNYLEIKNVCQQAGNISFWKFMILPIWKITSVCKMFRFFFLILICIKRVKLFFFFSNTKSFENVLQRWQIFLFLNNERKNNSIGIIIFWTHNS